MRTESDKEPKRDRVKSRDSVRIKVPLQPSAGALRESPWFTM